MGLDLGFEREVLQGLQRQHCLGDAALHIVDARSADGIALGLERHLRQRAHRPDCVEMTQQKLGARLAAPAGRPGMQHAAAEAPRHTPDDETKPLEFACDDLADFLLAVRLV